MVGNNSTLGGGTEGGGNGAYFVRKLSVRRDLEWSSWVYELKAERRVSCQTSYEKNGELGKS